MGSVDRLDVEDAIYTEGIHTNAGFTGFSEPITHASELLINCNLFNTLIKFLKHFILIGALINLVIILNND
jgi:hypothetical protein